MTNWKDIRQEWEQSDISFKALADKYGLKDTTIRSRKNREDWQRNDATQRRNVATKKYEKPPEREPPITIDGEGLNDKQILFVSYYLKYWNATKAYQKAYDCAYTTARNEGARLLANPCIKEAIVKARDEIFAESFLSSKAIIQKYMDIAFADITDFVAFGTKQVQAVNKKGEPLRDEDGAPVMVSVQYVEVVDHDKVDGTILSEVKEDKNGIGVKLSDRMKALEKLEKYMGMMSEEDRLKVGKLKLEIKQISGDGAGDAHKQNKDYVDALNNRVEQVFADEVNRDEEE